jgi:large subunit ribosomal protein L40
MKKKKKIDVSIIVGKELKRRKKLEKMIRKQEQKGIKLKPIEEIEGDRAVIKTLDKRKRVVVPLSFDECERRALLHKSWARYKTQQFVAEWVAVQRVTDQQTRALQELRRESEQLYQQAIQLDEALIPFDFKGPMETPPIKGYVAPDGEYVDTTRKFDK